jgi:hypothetical protein
MLSVLGLIQTAFFIALFYGVARLTFRFSEVFVESFYRLVIQWSVILILFACSFLRVLGESDIRGDTGTYNFWTASAHYIKIYPAYGSGRPND